LFVFFASRGHYADVGNRKNDIDTKVKLFCDALVAELRLSQASRAPASGQDAAPPSLRRARGAP
jgi:hypothetical protein